MATNRKHVGRFMAACAAILALAGCSSSSPGPDEAKSGDAGTPKAAALTLPDDPRQFVAEAMKAHSSEAALAQARLGRTKKRSVLHMGPSQQMVQTEICAYQMPDRLCRILDMEVSGKKGTRIIVIDGKQGWTQKVDGSVVERPPKEDEVGQVYPVGLLNGLRDLLEPKNSLTYIRSVAGDQDKEIGIRATGPDNKADYFFDKQRKLLVRVVTTQSDLVAKSSRVAEVRFSDFREVHGLTIAFSGQVYHDGTLREEWTLDEFEALRHIDDKVFSKPEGN